MNQKGIPMTPDQTGTATLTQDQVLDRIRAKLAEQKVPGAETRDAGDDVERPRRRLARPRRARQGARGPLRRPDRTTSELKPIASVGDAVRLVAAPRAERAAA